MKILFALGHKFYQPITVRRNIVYLFFFQKIQFCLSEIIQFKKNKFHIQSGFSSLKLAHGTNENKILIEWAKFLARVFTAGVLFKANDLHS